MAIHWHPLLAQFLREDYGDRLEIKDCVKIGKMPLELDILIVLSVPKEELPYPFNYLGGTTIAELKGPGATATWRETTQVENYGCLYQLREAKINDRGKITLWLIASRFSTTFNQPPEDYIDNLTTIGDGLKKGSLAKFPIYLVDLATLPITLHTIPLLIVYKGDEEREKEIIRFFIEHYQGLRRYSHFFSTIHTRRLEEVLNEMDLRNLRGLDLDVPAIIDLFGLDRLIQAAGQKEVIETIGRERVIETIGLDKVLESAGRERVLETLFPDFTKEQIKKLDQNGNR